MQRAMKPDRRAAGPGKATGLSGSTRVNGFTNERRASDRDRRFATYRADLSGAGFVAMAPALRVLDFRDFFLRSGGEELRQSAPK